MELNNDITIEELAASVAHEIKNPLAIIKANLQVMELSGEGQEKYYAVIYKEIDKINELLKDFMDITRPYEYKFEACNINEIIQNAINSFESVSQSQHIEIKTNLEAGIMATCDRRRLLQVLINLIKNAVEAFEPEHHGVISIKSFICDQYICLTLKDNGTGIHEEMLDKIGRPYFTTKAGGNGLGIPLAKKIIQDHNGVFSISSLPGSGTTISIMLPNK